MQQTISIHNRILSGLLICALAGTMLIGCGATKELEVKVTESESSGIRSNETVVLTPEAGGTVVYGTSEFVIDASNAGEGYLYITYSGENPGMKMQITGMDNVIYTYDIPIGDTVIPLTAGNGIYMVTVLENIEGSQFAALYTDTIDVEITNPTGPYLYPNQYVQFTKDTQAVALAAELAEGCTCDLEVVGKVYEYVTDHITYDHEKAENASAGSLSGYLPNVDKILNDGTGICFDYAALMAAMLRSQRIPSRLEIGYAGSVYHAWLSTYVDDIGWINGIINFDGTTWTLMDPTFAANTSERELKNFIGDGDNYTTKFIR